MDFLLGYVLNLDGATGTVSFGLGLAPHPAPPGSVLPGSAPLFEEEWYACGLALVPNGEYPLLLHRPGSGTASAHLCTLSRLEIPPQDERQRAAVFIDAAWALLPLESVLVTSPGRMRRRRVGVPDGFRELPIPVNLDIGGSAEGFQEMASPAPLRRRLTSAGRPRSERTLTAHRHRPIDVRPGEAECGMMEA